MRQNAWISVLLTVSCLGILENWQCVQSFDNVTDLRSVAKRIRGKQEFDENLPSGHEETSKRKKILTGSGTSSRDPGRVLFLLNAQCSLRQNFLNIS
jgi:hypothetical protein